MSNNFVQTVDVTASLDVPGRDIPDSFNNLAVLEAEIERVFAGGGSKAEVKVIFDNFLTEDEKSQIEEFVAGGDRDKCFVEYESPAGARATRLQLRVDVETTVLTGDDTETTDKRIFTGAVTKVTEKEDRTVTFNALDRRYELNKYMVQLDISEPTPVDEIVEDILTSGDNQGLQLDPGQYNIDIGGVDTSGYFTISAGGGAGSIVKVNNQTYGVKSHATVYEVLQDLAKKQNATIHIDAENVIHFTDYPQHREYNPETMPPIVEWDTGDTETESDVIVESPYDETGLGLYTAISREVTGERSQVVKPGKLYNEQNVFSREAVENTRETEIISNDLMRGSGTLKVIGDPEIKPYDSFVIDERAVDGFAPISYGTYISKTVRHIISSQDGYLTEIELGDNPEELFEQFTGQSAESWKTPKQEQRARESSEDGFWGTVWDVATYSPIIDAADGEFFDEFDD